MIPIVEIAGRRVGQDCPCLIIAEAGVNHNGSLELALQLVDAAAEAGADVVKFQTFHAEENISPTAPKAEYQVQTTGDLESQLDMCKKLELSAAAFHTIAQRCHERRVTFLSTPFDNGSVELLENLGVPAYKIASGEITNFPLLAFVAGRGKPLIMSTGMSDIEEVAAAIEVLQRAGNRELILLHCVSNYPAEASSVNLRAMKTLTDRFGVPVGFSDHTEGIAVPLAAVALGASVLEKHLTLDRSLPGPDHRASLEPAQLGEMVRGIRSVEAALGNGEKYAVPEELDTAAVARRSLVAARDLIAGTLLTEELIAIRRPGTGLPPAMLARLVGRRLVMDVPANALLSEAMFEADPEAVGTCSVPGKQSRQP